MTRLIGEPSDKRDISNHEYRVRQLERRPKPPGTPRPWIALENLGQTLPDDTEKFQLFTYAWWDPNLLTGDPLVSGADDDTYFSVDVATEDATDYLVLTTRLEGWYEFQLVSQFGTFTSPPATAGYALVFCNFSTPTGIHFELDKNIREAKDWSTGAVNELEAAPRVDIDGRRIYLPASRAWSEVKTRQKSGASRDFQSHLKVWYDGHFGSTTTDNADWSFESV